MSVRVAVITGAAGGIGRATALALAADGFAIALLDRSLPEPEVLLDELSAAGAPAAGAYLFDLAAVESNDALLDRIENELGPVDVLVNNAGVPATLRGDLLAIEPDNFDAVLDVNLRGTFFLTQAVARRMIALHDASRERSIVVVSSVSATMASVERGDYCLSKAALPMLVKLFALRLASAGIGVFEVRPGIIRTPMTEKVSARYDGLIKGGLVPAGRWGKGSDVARAISRLAAGGMNFATGTVVSVDGGLAIERL